MGVKAPKAPLFGHGSFRQLRVPPLADIEAVLKPSPEKRATRGTTNRNDRGNAEDRRRRREWLVETFRANQDLRWTPEGRRRCRQCCNDNAARYRERQRSVA